MPAAGRQENEKKLKNRKEYDIGASVACMAFGVNTVPHGTA